METRARFVLIGLFTLLGFLGGLGFILWLAKVQLDRTYAQYDIRFSTVAGLSQTGAVRYNGIDVGKVLSMAQDRADPALVRVRIEIYGSTPIRTDTIATLASQGVTGVSYIALEGGSAEAERLRAVPPAIVPVIQSEMSVVQDLMNSGPDLVAAATALINDVRTFTTPENRDTIAAILQDVERATGRIDALATRAEATLDRADAAIDAATKGLATADGLMKEEFPAMSADVAAALASATKAMDAVRGLVQSDAPRLTAEVSTLIRDASGVIATFDALARKIGNDPGRFLLGNETPEYRRAE